MKNLKQPSPNTNIDELAAKYITRESHKGSVNRVRHLLKEDLEALLSAAKEAGRKEAIDLIEEHIKELEEKI